MSGTTVLLIIVGIILGIVGLIVLVDIVAVFLIRRFLVRIIGREVSSLLSRILTVAISATDKKTDTKPVIDVEPQNQK